VLKVAAEEERGGAERAAEQEELDEVWQRLNANDPEITLAALDFKPSRTTRHRRRRSTAMGTGRRRSCSSYPPRRSCPSANQRARRPEAFAVAPGTDVVQMLVVRRETDKKRAGELAAIYVGGIRPGQPCGRERGARSGPR
jgi:hypothetical protein